MFAGPGNGRLQRRPGKIGGGLRVFCCFFASNSSRRDRHR